MQPSEEIRTDILGFTIAAKSFGNLKARPILCLHGMLDNAASFDHLAPLLPDAHIVVVDSPGNGFSSHYPCGVMPHWKNDAYLMLSFAKAIGWKRFDIIAHSLGSLTAMAMAIAAPSCVRRLVFLDVLGPKVEYLTSAVGNLRQDAALFLNPESTPTTTFPDRESALKARMRNGQIGYLAAKSLVDRGTQATDRGAAWTFDPRLKCVHSTLPQEDELTLMFQALKQPVCLIRAEQGIQYPLKVFEARSQSIQDLTTQTVAGRHHVHMDDPASVARHVQKFLFGD